MNLQEGGSQARIPQPWQWEVLVVGQEASASLQRRWIESLAPSLQVKQRVSVHSNTKMSDVLESLGLSDSTHEVVHSSASAVRDLFEALSHRSYSGVVPRSWPT